MSKKHDADDSLEVKPEVPELKEQLPDAATLAKQLEEAKQKADENWQLALRTKAELENFEKRSVRDIEQAHKFALEKFAKSLLPVVDSLERGLEATGQGDDLVKSLREGMELTLKLLMDTLSKFQVEQVNPVDQPFDPALHEALTAQPVEGQAPNIVVTVVQKGYTLHGRLIRPAQVIVSA